MLQIIRVKRAFVYFKTRSSNDCGVIAMHSMRLIDRQRKIPVTHYFRLSEGLNRQHFYQNDFFQNDSLFALLLSWIIIIFPQWRLKIRVSQLCASLTIFSWISLPSGEILHWNTPQPLGNFCLLAPLPSEFPLTFRGGGGGVMDIFWNCTFQIGPSLSTSP